MIELRDINDREFVLNSQLIEILERIPETKITLTSGKYILVKDSFEQVIDKIVDFNRRVYGAEREIRVKHEQIKEDLV